VHCTETCLLVLRNFCLKFFSITLVLYNISSRNALLSDRLSFAQKCISLLLIARSVECNLCKFISESFDWGKVLNDRSKMSRNIDRSSFCRRFHVTSGDLISGFLSQKFLSTHFVFVAVASFRSFVDSLENFLFLIELLFLWYSLCRGYFLVLSPSYYYSVLPTTWLDDFFLSSMSLLVLRDLDYSHWWLFVGSFLFLEVFSPIIIIFPTSRCLARFVVWVHLIVDVFQNLF